MRRFSLDLYQQPKFSACMTLRRRAECILLAMRPHSSRCWCDSGWPPSYSSSVTRPERFISLHTTNCANNREWAMIYRLFARPGNNLRLHRKWATLKPKRTRERVPPAKSPTGWWIWLAARRLPMHLGCFVSPFFPGGFAAIICQTLIMLPTAAAAAEALCCCSLKAAKNMALIVSHVYLSPGMTRAHAPLAAEGNRKSTNQSHTWWIMGAWVHFCWVPWARLMAALGREEEIALQIARADCTACNMCCVTCQIDSSNVDFAMHNWLTDVFEWATVTAQARLYIWKSHQDYRSAQWSGHSMSTRGEIFLNMWNWKPVQWWKTLFCIINLKYYLIFNSRFERLDWSLCVTTELL